jgi:hypothetical protein
MEWIFLVNCRDEIEAGMIMGVLKEEGIPTMEKYSGADGYMKIISGLGKNVDIMVAASHHARATEVLAALQEELEPVEP